MFILSEINAQRFNLSIICDNLPRRKDILVQSLHRAAFTGDMDDGSAHCPVTRAAAIRTKSHRGNP